MNNEMEPYEDDALVLGCLMAAIVAAGLLYWLAGFIL